MKRSPRGSSVVRSFREDSLLQVLEGTGPHVCIPWTGADANLSDTACPGFEWSANRGLLCYVIPHAVIRELRIFPGYLGTAQGTKPKDPDEIAARGSVEKDVLADTTKNAALRDFQRVLQIWLRLVKVSGWPETEWKYMPKNSDYQVVVIGPYRSSQYAVVSALASKDAKDNRFLISHGVDPKKAAAAGQKSNLPGGKVVAAVRNFEASSPSHLVGAGYPIPGNPPRMRMTVDGRLAVYSEPVGSPPQFEDLSKILKVDAGFKA
jgi:hypothetical protein